TTLALHAMVVVEDEIEELVTGGCSVDRAERVDQGVPMEGQRTQPVDQRRVEQRGGELAQREGRLDRERVRGDIAPGRHEAAAPETSVDRAKTSDEAAREMGERAAREELIAERRGERSPAPLEREIEEGLGIHDRLAVLGRGDHDRTELQRDPGVAG